MVGNTVNCIEPDQALNSFQGVIFKNNKKISLGPKQILLRGAMLKNTDWIIGIATYIGYDTKLSLNSGLPAYKMSNVEKIMNKIIFNLVIF